MATYFIGDVHGCDSALQQLLDEIDFSPSRDHLYLLGDLVNRGPDSTAVLRRCMKDEAAISVILGNHDLHLVARFYGARKAGRLDTLDALLADPQAPAMVHWLCRQPLVRSLDIGGTPVLQVHAGLLPQWTAAQAVELAGEVQEWLAEPGSCRELVYFMYGNKPEKWCADLTDELRLRAIINGMTRLRFCTPEGQMDFGSTENAENAPEGLVPWFDVPGRRSSGTLVAFGHWSTLGLKNRPDLLGIDTGCVWGGCLTAVRFGASAAEREIFHVACAAAQKPG